MDGAVDAARSLFYWLSGNNGKTKIWVSTNTIKQTGFDDIMQAALDAGEKITILTGTHGRSSGARDATASEFYLEDKYLYGDFGVVVRDVNLMDDLELDKVFSEKGTVVCAWCFSGLDQQLTRLLENLAK